jgi:cobalt/nickel transport system permease protein
MIDVARIDYWAANGAGRFHRASVAAKLVFFVCAVAAAIMARDPAPLALVYGFLVVLAAVCTLPWRGIVLLSFYAALFALFYAFSMHAGISLYALFVLKAVTPAYAVGMLITSTPYPRIFAFLSAVFPEVITSGLFMTYRTLFILLDMMHNFGTAIRLRGGFSPGNLVKNGSNIAKAIGALLVKAVERASRLFAVMSVRGYSGSMAERSPGRLIKDDWLPLGAGGGILIVVLAWRWT